MNFITIVSLVTLYTTYASGDCKDKEAYASTCHSWKKSGYCETYTRVRESYCRSTCGSCDETSCVDTAGSRKCEKYSAHCARGKWSDGSAFYTKCMKTCDKCGDSSSKEEDSSSKKEDSSSKKSKPNKEKSKSDNSNSDKSDNSNISNESDNSSSDSGTCEDENMCEGMKSYCESGSWGDGSPFFTKCLKTCGCCDGGCKEAESPECGAKTVEGPHVEYFHDDILKAHNKLRNRHKDTPMLTWDTTLQSYAQRHCDVLVDSNRGLWHSEGEDRGYSGENLAGFGSTTKKICDKIGSKAAQAWYDEIDYYDYTTGGKKAGDMTGHFTQMVWCDSTQVGCAFSVGKRMTYVCCNYNPPGNYPSKMLTKVKALKSRMRRRLQIRSVQEKRTPLPVDTIDVEDIEDEFEGILEL